MDDNRVRQLIKESFEDNYWFGAPRIPPHTHNDVDSPLLDASSIVGLTTGGLNGIQVFTASGTFTPRSGFTKYYVRNVGGGAGGGATSGAPTTGLAGCSGGYCEGLVDLTGVASVPVTIGAGGAGGISGGAAAVAGGNTTFGTYMTANGGSTGGGIGGTATGGSINITGYPSGVALSLSAAGTSTNTSSLSAYGGPSFFGPGGAATLGGIGSSSNGNDAPAYGGGGSGGASGSGGGNGNGGAGKQGITIVTW